MLLQSLYFSRFLPNHPRPLSSFDTHARWQPVTQSARSRRSYGKIEDCELSTLQSADWLAQWDKLRSAEQDAVGSNPCPNNTQGL